MKISISVALSLACYISLTSVYVRFSSGSGVASIREKIASTAEKYVGSTKWCYSCSSGHGANTYKCNYFVFDVGREAGASMPTRSFFRGPVGAGVDGWGTAFELPYWESVTSPQQGDIVSAHKNNVYHVGIYVAYRTTVSANSINVGRKSWPFGGGYSGIVYWRYAGTKKYHIPL